MRIALATLAVALAVSLSVAQAQNPLTTANPTDVESPEALLRAAYETVSRAPGKPHPWDRFRTLYLPEAHFIPNYSDRKLAPFRVHTVESLIAWLDESSKRQRGAPSDRGFAENHVGGVIERYGNVAHVMSVYEKHWWGDTTVLGRGINSIQMVNKDGRWWISSIAWDEEPGAGPIPAKYLPSKQ